MTRIYRGVQRTCKSNRQCASRIVPIRRARRAPGAARFLWIAHGRDTLIGERFTGPTKKQIMAVAEAGREIRRIRAEAPPNIKGGLRALYRTLELPGKHALKDAHAALDAAVLDAYGFEPPPPRGKGDLLKQLLDLNLAVAKRIERGEGVVAPGVPPAFGDPKAGGLITDDCIRPT